MKLSKNFFRKMDQIKFEQFEEPEIPAHATPENEMHHAYSVLQQKPKSHRWVKRLMVVLAIVALLGFGIFFAYRYLFAQSRDPHSTIGAAWIDLNTKSDSDPDQDGLSNAEEARLATNFWQYDTDGDGFSDGDEVKHGYNPNGAGKLIDAKFNFNSLSK